MARLIRRVKPLTTAQKKKRADKYQVSRSGVWIDKYPEVQGTRPEKMIYNELMARGIPFEFQQYIKIEGIDLETDPWYRPDFILREQKIIIEANGAYWHIKDSQVEADAFKYALYEMMGWKVIVWWDYEIEDHLKDLFDKEPALAWRPKPLMFAPPNASGKNDSAGIATINAKKRKPWTKKPVSIKVKKRRKSRR